jgi:hypothetical protein
MISLVWRAGLVVGIRSLIHRMGHAQERFYISILETPGRLSEKGANRFLSRGEFG